MTGFTVDDATVERLARATHDMHASEGPNPHPAVQWDSLPDDTRELNLDQIRSIPAKLAAAGLELAPLADGGEPLEFDDEVVERLAVLEHERWHRFYTSRGWVAASATNVVRRQHSSLVEFERLSDDEAEKDRMVVRRIPWLIALAGLGVRRPDSDGS